jgi:hypothetical protein
MASKEKPTAPRKKGPTPAPKPSPVHKNGAKTAPAAKSTPKPTAAKATDLKKPRATAVRKATNIASTPTAAYLDLAGDAPAPTLGNIPWGYGDVRIVGMARDPQWACAYWEVSDDSIKDAQQKLNDPHAGLSLRVYDTTNVAFNGLNAHVHWDLGVERNTTVYHFKVGKPGATIHVDIGVRNWHGGFQPIARSNSVEMPRDSISGDLRFETSTVFRAGPEFSYRHRYTPPPSGHGHGPGPGGPGGGFYSAPHPAESEHIFKQLSAEGWSRSEWMETLIDGRVMRWIRWSGPIQAEHLQFLPKTGATFRTVEVLFQGERRVIKMEGGEKIIFGPWKVVIEAVGSQGERKTIERWMVRQRWTTHEGMVRVETPAILTRILGGRRVTVTQGGSEARLAQEEWGSQVLQLGASEWRWIGASETMMQGSSETIQRGSSELFYLGASETVYQGASEMIGSSETLGASELLFLGASDTFELGGSENVGGSSEERP